MVSIWHKETMCAEFAFFWCFLNILWIFEFGSKPRFYQHLNKFKTWKWKTKPGSFLAFPKWSLNHFKLGQPSQNHVGSTPSRRKPRDSTWAVGSTPSRRNLASDGCARLSHSDPRDARSALGLVGPRDNRWAILERWFFYLFYIWFSIKPCYLNKKIEEYNSIYTAEHSSTIGPTSFNIIQHHSNIVVP